MNNTIFKYIKGAILFIFIMIFFTGGLLSVCAFGAMQQAPEVKPEQINNIMNQTSEIVDQQGNLIEKVNTVEYREVVSGDKIPKYLHDAFISVEDERFYSHPGIDPIGIGGAIIENLKTGSLRRGASTIAQQLARNLYLTNEKSFDRKFKEIYLALQLTDKLGREKVIETYMNTVFLGQNAYGVQAASEIYFSKDVSDLTIAESAALAGIVQSPSNLALYRAIEPGQIQDESKIVGEVSLSGRTYKAVYNQDTLNRQKYVLYKMEEQKKITPAQYQKAKNENIVAQIDPGVKDINNLSNYYSDVVYSQVIDKLMEKLGYTEEDARNKLVNGGLKIYACVDMDIQNRIEEEYDQLVNNVIGYDSLLNWSSDENGNLINSQERIVYFKKEQILTENDEVVITKDQFRINPDRSITFFNSKNSPVKQARNYLDVLDYYSQNENGSLVTHQISGIHVGQENMKKNREGDLTISKDFLTSNPNFYTLNENENMILNKDYYTVDDGGIVQPQSSTVVIDHKTGQLKAIIGGRTSSGSDPMNRAFSVPRQAGSTIKPLAVYLPALDNGYTAATGIDDVPYYDRHGNLWPKNWYNSYRGIVSLRHSVEDSINVNAVKTLEDIGIDTSKKYLQKVGLINPKNPGADNYISSAEDPQYNDENQAAMGLGSLTRGFTNFELTAAYASIANDGEYIQPTSFTKITDSQGNVLLENVQNTDTVVTPQVNYIMKDILKTSTDYNYAKHARKDGYDIAGKTGTTQEYHDVWFEGFSDYYTIGTWIGFDNQQLSLTDTAGESVVRLWASVNDITLENEEPKTFEEPSGIVHLEVDTISGKLPTQASYADPRGTVREELFVKGTEPTEEDDVHVMRQVNLVDRLLATNLTPSWEIGYMAFIERPIPYDPSEHNYIYPEDWNFRVPMTYSGRTIYNVPDPSKKDDEEDKDDDDKDDDDKDKKDKKRKD